MDTIVGRPVPISIRSRIAFLDNPYPHSREPARGGTVVWLELISAS